MQTILFAIILFIIVVVLIRALYQRRVEIVSQEDPVVDNDVEAYKNSKIPKEKDHVEIKHGKFTILLTPAEALIFNSYDRQGKREWIRDYLKLMDKQKKK